MSDETLDDIRTESIVLPGDTLRQARERQALSVLSVSQKLRLRLSVIEDIENNRFDQENITTFMRGYVRSYAKLLGLDESELLQQMDALGHTPHQEHEMQSFSRRTKRESNDSRLMGFSWLMGIVIIGLSGVWWWQNEFQAEPPIAPETLAITPTTPAPDPIPVVEAVQQAQVTAEAAAKTEISTPETLIFPDPPQQETVSEASDVLADNNAESAMPIVSPEAELAALNELIPTYNSDLELEFSGDCWVEVRNENGRRLESKLKKSGQKLAFDGDGPFKIVLGAPGVVKMRYKGEAVDLSRYSRRGRVARFTWPQ